MKRLVKYYIPMLLIGIGLIFFIIPSYMSSKLTAPKPTKILLDRHGYYLGQMNSGRESGFGYWSFSDYPVRFAEATIALEDKKFYYHPGVDPIAIFRAFWQNLKKGRRISGASTIAMQTARLQNPSPRTYYYKTREALTALFMTIRYGREDVLKHYLKIIPYGHQGYGISYASRMFFNKPAQDLSWAEIAFLSSIPHAPGRMNPYSLNGLWQTKKRAKNILIELKKTNILSKHEYTQALTQIDYLQVSEKNARPDSSLHVLFHAENEISNKSLFPDDTIIHSTIDLNLQEQSQNIISNHLKSFKKNNAGNISLLIGNVETKEIIAWLGSAGYFTTQAGAYDFTHVVRSPGSTVKPFIYAYALENGIIKTNTILEDTESRSLGFFNSDHLYFGPILPRYALANSRNIPSIDLVRKIGIDEVYTLFNKLKFHSYDYSSDHYGALLGIGSLPVTLFALMNAYITFADNGIYSDLTIFKNMTRPDPINIFSPETSYIISDYLSDPMARLPVFSRLGPSEYPFPVSIKTGTSKGYRDGWTIAWTDTYIVGVWVGRGDNKPMHELGGTSSAALVVKSIINKLHADRLNGLSDSDNGIPEGFIMQDICGYTGKRSSVGCRKKIQEIIPESYNTTDYCNPVIVEIDNRNNQVSTRWTPEEFRRNKIYPDLNPIYNNWAKKNHIDTIPASYSLIDVPVNERMNNKIMPFYPGDKIKEVKLNIVSPVHGMKLIINPDLPEYASTLVLSVTTDKTIPQVLWYVDDHPYKVTESPFTTTWNLKPGKHTFQVKLPYRDEVSEKITVEINH